MIRVTGRSGVAWIGQRQYKPYPLGLPRDGQLPVDLRKVPIVGVLRVPHGSRHPALRRRQPKDCGHQVGGDVDRAACMGRLDSQSIPQ